MTTTTWQNKNKPMSHQNRYGIANNTAIYNIDTHELHPTQSIKDNQIDAYISLSTFDGEFIILQYENQIGKFQKNFKISVKQLVRIKTHFPIFKCHLSYQYKKAQHKDALIGYLIDIYSNIYTVNFTTYIDYYKTIGAQPVKYVQLFKNVPIKYNENFQNIYLQTPLFIFKDEGDLFTINLNGQLKILRIDSQKSFVKEIQQYDVSRCKFQDSVLAAICSKTKTGYLMVVAFHNGRSPYLFVNCRTVNDFQQQYRLQNQNDDLDSIEEVSYVSYDPSSNYVIVSLVSQKIQIYQISQIKKHNKTYYLKRIFGFFINNHLQFHNLNIDYNIEHIHINQGILMITTCKQFIIYDIKNREIKRKMQNQNLSHFKYGKIIDKNDNYYSCALIKGFNHINQNQSKIGKPNIHFVLYEFTKNKSK